MLLFFVNIRNAHTCYVYDTKIKMNEFWVTYVVADSMFFFSFMNTKMKKLLPNCDYI